MPTASFSLYALLGLTKASCPSTVDIARAFRRLALQYHPDRNPDGTEQFKKIHNAYAVLSDEERRAVYDTTGVVPGEGAGSASDSSSTEAQAQRAAEVAGQVAAFYATYRGSEEEVADVGECYRRCGGDFGHMVKAELLFDNSKEGEVRRLRELIIRGMASGALRETPVWKQTSSDKALRKLEVFLARERKEAQEVLQEFSQTSPSKTAATATAANGDVGSNGDCDVGDLGSLRALIQNRQKQQWEDMVLSMEARYLGNPSTREDRKKRSREAESNTEVANSATKQKKRGEERRNKEEAGHQSSWGSNSGAGGSRKTPGNAKSRAGKGKQK